MRHQGGQRRLEAGDPDQAGVQADQRGQFRGGGVDPADDLGGAAGQVLALGGEPDAPAARWTSLAPVSASSLARWRLTAGWE